MTRYVHEMRQTNSSVHSKCRDRFYDVKTRSEQPELGEQAAQASLSLGREVGGKGPLSSPLYVYGYEGTCCG